MNKTNITVREWMSQPVHTAHPHMSVGEAYDLMMQKSIRRLPVVNSENNKLLGIVTLGDLREARPSPATSLSIYELNYLLSRLQVGQVMTHNPYTVTPDTPIQEAARIMLERKISGLPVVAGNDEHDEALGIITESDIFRMLIDQWDYFTKQHIDAGLFTSLIAQEINR